MNEHVTVSTSSPGRWVKTPWGGYHIEEFPEKYRAQIESHRNLERAEQRHRGMRRLTNEELRRIAAMNPPPPVWFDEDQEIPFA